MMTGLPGPDSSMPNDDYELLDSGAGAKLERFGKVVLDRPCAQAMWRPRLSRKEWDGATASFDRKEGNRWLRRDRLPESWEISIDGIRLGLGGTDFGHLGVFPEQRMLWRFVRRMIGAGRSGEGRPSVLNLFAYSGGATLAAALSGAEVCHVDASRGMVDWARENAGRNGIDPGAVRWIVDDVGKFLKRELRRKRTYDAVILDPPSFGRGAKGEVYKIERDLSETLEDCRGLLSPNPLFVLLSSHTPSCTPTGLSNMLESAFGGFKAFAPLHGEMLLCGGPEVLPVPNGSWACLHDGRLPALPAKGD